MRWLWRGWQLWRPLCWRRGYHRWNVLGGFEDGTCGPVDKSGCQDCNEVYHEPPPPPLSEDAKKLGLNTLLENYAQLKKSAKRYPTHGNVGKYHFWFDYKWSIDQEIEKLQTELGLPVRPAGTPPRTAWDRLQEEE